MNISDEIALIVCKSQKKLENESDVEFANRLYDIFRTCSNSVGEKISEANTMKATEGIKKEGLGHFTPT